MIEDFKKFIMRGNVIDMAVGIIIGAAFSTIVKSLVDDILMPFLGLITSGIDFKDIFWTLKEGATPGPYLSLKMAKDAGAITMNAGVFINSIITFLFVAAAVFMLVRFMNRLYKREEATDPKPTPQEILLGEIRDILKKK